VPLAKAKSSLFIATSAVDRIYEQVGDKIHTKQLEKLIKPTATRISIDSLKKVAVSAQLIDKDNKRDDKAVIDEQATIGLPFHPVLSNKDKYLIHNDINP